MMIWKDLSVRIVVFMRDRFPARAPNPPLLRAEQSTLIVLSKPKGVNRSGYLHRPAIPENQGQITPQTHPWIARHWGREVPYHLLSL